MVVIRLARHGAHKAPFYRVVVTDKRVRRDGRCIEQVGTYDPTKNPSEINLDIEKIDAWIAKGAQPSERVAKLIAIVKGEPLPAKSSARAAAQAKKQEAAAEKEEAAAEEPAAEEAEAGEEA